MTKKAMRSIFGKLLELPTQITRAEADLLARDWSRQEALAALQAREDALLIEGVDGKNAEARAAQLRQHTEAERQRALLAERAHAEARVQLSALTTEFAAMRSAARLLSEARR